MNIALIVQHKLLQGLQRLFSGPTAQASQPQWHSHAQTNAAHTPRGALHRNTFAALPERAPVTKLMPLRVVRVIESGMPRSSAGRLVISGRMADVCAELDRLVERESALH